MKTFGIFKGLENTPFPTVVEMKVTPPPCVIKSGVGWEGLTKAVAPFFAVYTESGRMTWKETDSGFVIRISFDIRHSSFVIRHSSFAHHPLKL